jgi:hypothetical protein
MKHDEQRAQEAIMSYLRLALPDCLMWHTPNGEARTALAGVLPGVPDIIILHPTGRTYFIEVKAGKGAPRIFQRVFKNWSDTHGFPFGVVRDIDSAAALINRWGLASSVRVA